MWKAFFIVSLSLSTGRDDQTRTGDPYVPNVVRYQLRYIPLALEKPAAKVLQIFELRAVLQKKICCYEKNGLTL